MATESPTPNHDWVLPVPGGSVGAWGDMLNKIFAEDGTPLGIDGVLGLIQGEIGDAETDIATLTGRVETLEAVGGTAFYFRGHLDGFDASIPEDTLTALGLDEDFQFGDMGHASSVVTLPAGADGLWEVCANVTVEYHAALDDARRWRIEIHKNDEPIATALTPALNDGVSAGSGDITLSTSTIVRAVEGDRFTVNVFQTGPGNADVRGTTAGIPWTIFELVRLSA